MPAAIAEPIITIAATKVPARTDADHPELTTWFKTQPTDPDLLEAERDYRQAAGRLHLARGRATAARLALADLDGDLFLAADDQTRRALLARRAELVAELGAAPNQIAEATRRLVPLHLAWLAGVARLAASEVARLDEQMAAPGVALDALRQRLHNEAARIAPFPTMTDEESAALQDEATGFARTIAPLRNRQDRARMAADVARGLATNAYGPGVNLAQEYAWPDITQLAVARAVAAGGARG